MNDPTVIVGTITAIGVIFGIFMKYLSGKDKSQEKRDEAFVKALSSLDKAMNSVARETKKAATEAAQRNGHLAELAMENQAANAVVQKDILNTIAKIKTQTVGHQVVEEQVVKDSHTE